MSEGPYTEALANFARTTLFDDIPERAVNAARRLIKDTIGCAVAGYSLPSSTIIRRVIGSYGGADEATVLVSGQKLPAALATYINSHLSNAIDGDDTLNFKTHMAAATVPPALAMCERQRRSGRDLLAAVAVGYEVAGRIGMAMDCINLDEDGQIQVPPTGGFGYTTFASAVAAGRLLDLDAAAMLNCFGIAGATALIPAGGAFGKTMPRAMTKYGMWGTIGEAGITAALLAAEGFTGERSILDGGDGLWRMMGSLNCDWNALTEKLGERWLVEEVAYKPYPGCRILNPAIDMFYDLCRTNCIQIEDIESIEVGLFGVAIQKRMGSHDVVSMVDGCFSAPYLLAAAALLGPPGPAWHTDEARNNLALRQFMNKVHVKPEPRAAAAAIEDLKALGHGARMPSSLRIVTPSQQYSAYVEYCRGDVFIPGTALSENEINDKFTTFASDVLTPAKIGRAIHLIDQLEDEPTIDDLLDNLVVD